MKAHIIPEEAQALAASKAREERKGGKGGAKGKAAAAAQASADAEAAAKKTAWEAKSNQLREAMRAAREYKAAVASGIDPRDIPPPVMSSAPDPSLVPCPHCGRTFNEHSAERHIPKCQSTRARVSAGSARADMMPVPPTHAHPPLPSLPSPLPSLACAAHHAQARCRRGGGCGWYQEDGRSNCRGGSLHVLGRLGAWRLPKL